MKASEAHEISEKNYIDKIIKNEYDFILDEIKKRANDGYFKYINFTDINEIVKERLINDGYKIEKIEYPIFEGGTIKICW